MKEIWKDYAVIDLFCGIGGLTHGFIKEDFKVTAGIDSDASCKFAFETNNKAPFLNLDITELKGEDLIAKYDSEKRILVGCAPCQPFSLYAHRNRNKKLNKTDDNKWKLLYSFTRLINEVQPDIISMENVPQLVNYDNGKVFNDFVTDLKKNDYFVSYGIVNAQDFGVPQRRKRLVLLASRLGEIDFISKTIKDKKYITVREAIGNLPPIEDGIPHPIDPLHRARKLSDLNKRRIRATKEGGFWRDWDKSLWLDCHKKKSGKSFRSVYGRMSWDNVAPTMTTCCTGLGNGRFGHPEQDRAITLREAALFQSFPMEYQFFGPDNQISTSIIARQIGNAVPVNLGVAIAKAIKNHIQQYS